MSRNMTKQTKWPVRPAKIQISLGIRPVWSKSSLCARRKLWSWVAHWAHSEDSDQSGRMPRLIRVFVGRTATLLVLSWGGSYEVQRKCWNHCKQVTRERKNIYTEIHRNTRANGKQNASWDEPYTIISTKTKDMNHDLFMSSVLSSTKALPP